jgi:hypothetical protein
MGAIAESVDRIRYVLFDVDGQRVIGRVDKHPDRLFLIASLND